MRFAFYRFLSLGLLGAGREIGATQLFQITKDPAREFQSDPNEQTALILRQLILQTGRFVEDVHVNDDLCQLTIRCVDFFAQRLQGLQEGDNQHTRVRLGPQSVGAGAVGGVTVCVKPKHIQEAKLVRVPHTVDRLAEQCGEVLLGLGFPVDHLVEHPTIQPTVRPVKQKFFVRQDVLTVNLLHLQVIQQNLDDFVHAIKKTFAEFLLVKPVFFRQTERHVFHDHSYERRQVVRDVERVERQLHKVGLVEAEDGFVVLGKHFGDEAVRPRRH